MRVCALIVAAGRGTRAGGPRPKQWQSLGKTRVIDHTLATFEGHKEVAQIAIVLHPDDMNEAPYFTQRGVKVAIGGAERSDSVRAGLAALPDCDLVLIHDAARPCVSAQVISDVIAALETSDGAAPGVAVSDALWVGDKNCVSGTKDRNGLFAAQTPQGFRYKQIVAAHADYVGTAADDVAVARAAGLNVTITAGDPENIKITTPTDFARATRILEKKMDIRTGNGFDVHAFGPGDHVMLCGVKIPHDHGLVGHSDADVGLHTITDAIYGALAAGDIGTHFPPSDPQWKGAQSHIFLRHAADLARDQGFTITHVDCTLICEHPKVGPHAAAMRAAVADMIGIDVDRTSVKATTSERLGFTGRGEGIACMATATLVKT
ncbi:bifunctional 2-C-methyl-D-erythritol 4-phosphate cytidylyltransferase/2-C-methyl-D-erythritol 2,4-cyclodiphosphate synthase [Sulfitobacter donghicola]|uniref:Bifunctional enzyme IspD/IspF n=1 Tax=Sulfitobacter donghicola DSW-25 = KCTC 12864 = JCM 14565 TaxID=1300350 RepID=A0A073IFY9_9RHOB|nr:bifunctional 2-C-methyl-D-erythritol 4-phosphate cytidylyltransferase/2-C-methyl-D-erythritol 2,4-cyclodiphosphate synthase [Sulfitobacter donghicola]KEJ88411.1 2-C-methyl-D-erythritol 4-phosphate cytidylyltransferase [Sulfitobacter donghicola DSW-25 = KCTC 12864 = JCM 14565]KIN69722.1 2-C-methyl-D-erythritol 4-phosphate cytidylyltransferase/ 2C-methyl-D-erythritol 2,4-cyclodiphosphate synthase [Sulfitobacter donghicola DSW-25 = KCTC 12864 = JCM 14565]